MTLLLYLCPTFLIVHSLECIIFYIIVHFEIRIKNYKQSAVCRMYDCGTLREESSQTHVILQYKLQASILSAVCCVIQQS